jgi:hypothetical protein
MAGEGTYDGDWGLSSDRDGSEDDSPRETHYDFAPPSRLPKRKFTSNELKPLIIVNENISRSTKFYNLFSVFHLRRDDLICRLHSLHMFLLRKQHGSKNDYGISSVHPNFFRKRSLPHFILILPPTTILTFFFLSELYGIGLEQEAV